MMDDVRPVIPHEPILDIARAGQHEEPRLIQDPGDIPPDNVVRAVQGIHHCTAGEARQIIARDLDGEDQDQTAPVTRVVVDVKKYGITRRLVDLGRAEKDIGATTGELYAMLQRDGQTQCHRLHVEVVAYVEVDTLPTELNAGIIPEHINTIEVEHQESTA